jgi:hypothetical protein
MPLDALGWDFVCWTPPKIETAVFTHCAWACRDALIVQRAALRAKLAQAYVALDELFEGPPEVWRDWWDRNKSVYERDDELNANASQPV